MRGPSTLTVRASHDPSARYQLRRDAVEEAKGRNGWPTDEAAWTALGLARRTYYRLFGEATSICACRAQSIADRLGCSVDDAFIVKMRRG
ncbi:hypothetical protein ACGFIW_02095 [Micromonospora sp. NPDC048935]|uniref:hypothetical protein n=1 Tax=Micromonospora sp. NPDC048935 TaxID=3364262 RepID=UPI00371630AD